MEIKISSLKKYIKDAETFFETIHYGNLTKELEQLWNKHIPITQLSSYTVENFLVDDDDGDIIYQRFFDITFLDSDKKPLKELDKSLIRSLKNLERDIEKLNKHHVFSTGFGISIEGITSRPLDGVNSVSLIIIYTPILDEF